MAVAAVDLPEWVETPALLLDLEVAEANVRRMQALCDDGGKRLVPHAKTHKLPTLGRLQLESGAAGLTLAKLGEAEVFAQHHLGPLFVANQVVGPRRAERLAALAVEGEVAVGVDNVANARALSEALSREGTEAGVLVEVDTGLHRGGLEDSEGVARLGTAVADLRGLRLEGVFTHEGHVYRLRMAEAIQGATEEAADRMRRAARALEKEGLPCERVSMGSTPSARFAASLDGINELRPGTYVFNDANQVALGAATVEACAATVLATVTSRPTLKRAVLDAGSKALSGDGPVPAARGYGLVVGHPDAVIERLYEEHAVVTVPPEAPLGVGDRVEVIPTHVCPVFNLFEAVHVVRDGRFLRTWFIAARGRST